MTHDEGVSQQILPACVNVKSFSCQTVLFLNHIKCRVEGDKQAYS